MSAFMRYPGFLDKALTLSYDDGTVHDKKLIEIMGAYGLSGTFNICSFADEPNNWKLTEKEARELYLRDGIEVAVHGARHLTWTEVEPAVAARDIMANREKLESLFGKIVNGAAYPCGAYNDKVVEILRNSGIKYSRTTVSTGGFALPKDWLRLSATAHHKDPNLMEYTERFLNTEKKSYFWSNKPKLFYLWGHSFEFASDNNWDVIERFGEKLGGRDDIWYATNGEIYDYVNAFERLIFSVDLKYVENPSAIDVYVNILGKELVVPSGKMVEIK